MRVPGKAAWLEFEGDPELEFEFSLAADLGMTVARLRAEMTQQEFVYWTRFHMRRNAREEIELARVR
jgi:hypothetical protein